MNALFDAIEVNNLRRVRQLLNEDPACLHRPFSDIVPNLPLHTAAHQNASKIAQLLIQTGAGVNARGDMGRTPLHYAAAEGCVEATHILVDAGADLNLKDDRGWTPLLAAVRGRESECRDTALLLYKRGAEVDLNALVSLGETEAACHLLLSDKDAIAKAVIPEDLISDFVIMLGQRIFEEAGDPDSPDEQTRVIAKYRDILPCLLAAGADVNGITSSGEPPLFSAARTFSSEVVRLLLEHGADPNITSPGNPKWNAWTVATGDYSKGVHRALREFGFNLFDRDKGKPTRSS